MDDPSHASADTSDGKSGIVALVIGVVALLTSFVAIGLAVGIPGMFYALLVLRRSREKSMPGHGPAMAGLICSVAAIVIATAVILLSPFHHSRPPAYRMTNSTQLRGIQQSMVIFAQGNKSHFPGLESDGSLSTRYTLDLYPPPAGADGNHPAFRLALLLHANSFTPEYVINPKDESKTEATPEGISSVNYSYAMLDIRDDAARRREWAETIHSEAPVLSDRNTGASADKPESLWTGRSNPGWVGTVVNNDNSTTFARSAVIEKTRYDDAEPVENDHLFKADTDDASDALMHFE